jgi:hypothetical protein
LLFLQVIVIVDPELGIILSTGFELHLVN